MGFLTTTPSESDEIALEQIKIIKERFANRNKLTPAEELAKVQRDISMKRLKASPIGRTAGAIKPGSREVLRQASIVAGQSREQPDFSSEQRMLGKMFGQGEHIWGVNNQPVTINNDLNSSRSDPYDETAGMFGFGDHGERSGLF